MTTAFQQGRQRLLILFGFILLVLLLISYISFREQGMQSLISHGIRLTLVAVFMVLTYKGYKAGIWVLTGIFIINAVYQISVLPDSDPLIAVPALLFYIFTAFYLQFSPSISEYFESTRQQRKQRK